MDRRKAMAVLGATACAGLPSFEGEAHKMQPQSEGEECLHCAVIRVNAEKCECPVCGVRIRHKTTGAFSLIYNGHKDGA